jgi:NUDIX domain
MAKITECSIIIKDDFNNVFIVQRKTKKNEPKLWYIIARKLRGKETAEKCISRAIKEDLKSIVFNLEQLSEELNEGLVSLLYKGEIKERITYGNDIVEGRWISLNEIYQYEFAPGEREKLLIYYDK